MLVLCLKFDVFNFLFRVLGVEWFDDLLHHSLSGGERLTYVSFFYFWLFVERCFFQTYSNLYMIVFFMSILITDVTRTIRLAARLTVELTKLNRTAMLRDPCVTIEWLFYTHTGYIHVCHH